MNSLRIAIPLVSLALLAGCGKQHESAARPELPPAKVRLMTARAETLPSTTEVMGSVRPVEHAMVAAKVMGAIEELPVALGQRVKAGDLLVKISASEISAKVLQAQAQFNMAKRDLDRERDLLAKNASTADIVKNLEDRYAMISAMVKEAEVMLGYTKVRTPFDGVVARKMANAGDLAAPGMPLVEIEGFGSFQVEAGVPDSLADSLKSGMPVSVEIGGAAVTGTLTEISSAADPYARTVQVKIALPAGTSARSGQFARTLIPGAPAKVLLVPETAVSRLGQMERIFVARDKHLELRLVKTGQQRGAQVEVLSGLSDGESVVATSSDSLVEGQPVEVQP